MYKKLNYAIGDVASTTAIGATTLTLKAGHTITTDTGEANKFVAVFYGGTKSSPYQDTTREIVEAYRTDTNDFVIARAKENTIAKEWVENDKFMLIASAGVFDEYETAVDAKAPLTAPTFATSITGSYLTASEMLITDANKNIVSAPVATYPSLTELSYVKGLSSAIQTQLGDKAPLISPSFTTPNIGAATGTSLALEGTALGILTLKNTAATAYTRMLFDGTGTDFSVGVGNASASIADLQNKFHIYDFTNSKTAFTIVPDTLAAKLYGSLEVVGGLTGTVTLPKTTKIQDTSADHTYNLAVSELTADRTVTLPLLTGNDEFVFKDHTQTLTKKRINPRLVTATSYTTDTGTSLDVSTCDQFEITAQAGDLKFNNPSGTPLGGQKLIIRIKDSGTARALTYDTQFRAVGVELPATTVISKTLYMGFIFNSADTKWDLLAVAQEA